MDRKASGSGWAIGLTLVVTFVSGRCAELHTPTQPLPERAYLSFLGGRLAQIPGRSTGREFLFRLPEHVRFAEGSELHLVLRAEHRLWRALCSLRVSMNGRLLFEGGPALRLVIGTNEPAWRLSLPVDPQAMERDWNRVTLRFLLCKPEGARSELTADLAWELHDADSFFTFVYERLPLFPELRRFPNTMGEENLLRMPFSSPDTESAGVAVLIPSSQRDVHRRAVAVLGTCLGKPGYLPRCEVGTLSGWESAVRERHGLVVGLRDELQPVSLPEALREPLTRLNPGQGLLAEHIFGEFPHQRRWILVAGADEPGLTKALQTLVCPSALLTVPPNPSVINTAPDLGDASAQGDATGHLEIPIRTAEGQELSFRGIYETEQTFLGWQLPPGRQTGSGGFLELAFRHSTNLLAPESFLEATVQGQLIGRIDLIPETAAGGQARLALPAGLAALGPLPIVLRAHLDVARTDCHPSAEDQVWLTLSAGSRLVCRTAPAAADSLARAQTFLLSNPHLSDTVFLLPAKSSLADLNWLLDFARRLGEQLSFLEALWPDVQSYGPNQTPPTTQVEGRRILLLGSVRDWPMALPTSHSLLIQPGSARDEVQLQGRRYTTRQFEPSLAFLNLVDAPGSTREKMLVAGGWQSGALPALTRMLLAPDSLGSLYGVACAMDAAGRSAAYDPRHSPRESFAECLLRNIPPGLTLEETVFERYRLEAKARSTARINFAISVWLGALLLLLAGSRVWLLWERSRIHQQIHRRQHD